MIHVSAIYGPKIGLTQSNKDSPAPKRSITYLIGGFKHLEKHEFVNGKDDIPYMKWNIKAMFETTNQIYGTSTIHYYYH